MILVLGGGFGLYGHLAALAGMDRPVAVPARYRARLLDRPELAELDSRIKWVDEDRALAAASHVVLARRPEDNAAMAEALIQRGYTGFLVSEKPLAPSPARSEVLGERLAAAGIDFAVPYLLLNCAWTPDVRAALAGGSRRVRIDWAFRQSASAWAWKRMPDQGGGNLAFYFIHCIALAEGLLAGADYRWSYAAGGEGREKITLIAERDGAVLEIIFDQMANDTYFRIAVDDAPILLENTPFGGVPQRGVPDPRIPVLQSFYRDDVFGAPRPSAFHRAVAQRWDSLARHIAAV